VSVGVRENKKREKAFRLQTMDMVTEAAAKSTAFIRRTEREEGRKEGSGEKEKAICS
jgi:hypothetical protein